MSWTSDNLGRNLKLFQVYSFFREIDFTRAVFIVYLLGLGVSNTQIGVLQTVLFLSIVLFEVPSGMLADRFKRKWVLAGGSILMAAAFAAFYFVGGNFYLLVPVFALIGASFALNSGSDSALLYDGLAQTDNEKMHLGVMGKNRSLSTMALCLSVAAGGFLLELEPSAIFLLTAVCALASVGLIAAIPESSMGKSESVKEEYKKFFKTTEGKNLFKFILLLGLIESIYTPMFIFAQSLFKEQGLSSSTISIVVAAAFLIEAFSFRYVAKLEKFKTSNVIYWVLGAMAASLIGVYLAGNVWVSVGMFLVYNTLPAMLFAKTDDYIQSQSKSEIRASLTSTQSLVSSLGISAGYLLFGLGFDTVGAAKSLAVVAMVAIVIAGGFFVYFERGEKNVLEIA